MTPRPSTLLRKWMGRLSVGFMVAVFSTAAPALGQVAGAGTAVAIQGDASAALSARLAGGAPQDVLVVYDDTAIVQEAQAMQLQLGVSSRDRRIIELKATRFADQKQQVLSGLAAGDVKVLKRYSHLPVSFMRIYSRAALTRLLARPGVAGVYENRRLHKTLAESLPLIGQPQVAAQGDVGTGTAVAVLDTGADYTLPAFGSCTAPGVPAGCKVVYAQDFAPNDGQLDDDGHGTNVAGIVAGVAPGAKIVALDVFSSDGFAYDSDILDAMNWVIANKTAYNIVAINLSVGGDTKYIAPHTSSPYAATVSTARAAGILTVAASGNSGFTDGLSDPAATAGVVSVGAVYDSDMGLLSWRTGSTGSCTDAVTAADQVTCFSNSASFLTLLAPGAQITAAGITESGTSQAAPHVAGAVAVLRAAYPGESLDQTVARLTDGVMVIDTRNDIVKPRLDLPTALGLAASCAYSISASGQSFGPDSAAGSVAVTTGPGCQWGAASDTGSASWLTVTSGSSGTGSGIVNYTVAPNTNAASRTGTLTVAGQTYTVTQSGSVGGVVNILLNSGFEDGPVSWTQQSSAGYPVITNNLNSSASGWYAWLCGYDNCVDTLSQDAAIPADAKNAYVQFSYQVKTNETTSIYVYDAMEVRLYSPPNASTYTTLGTLSNLDASFGWLSSPQYDVSAFKGKTVRLQLSATSDATLSTSFYVDNVTLMVNGSAPDTQPPTTPAGLTATVISASTVNLGWSAASDNLGVTSYKVYRDAALVATLGNVHTYSDTGLTAATTYSYTVVACDAAGNCSAQSPAVTARTANAQTDTQAPTVPAGLTAMTAGTGTINLSWSAATDDVGVTTYKLYRNGTLRATLGNVLSYVDGNLYPSTSYSYTVAACDAAGNCSAQSTAVFATTSAPVQSSPIHIEGGSTFQTGGGTVSISIDKITNTSSTYTTGSLRIELWALSAPYAGGSVTGYITASIRTNQITGLADQLPPDTTWSAIDLNLPYTAPPPGNPDDVLFVLEYDPVNCTTTDHFCIATYLNYHEIQPPTVPAALTATAADSARIDLAWSAATDNVGVATYQVYRDGNLVAILGNVTAYSDVGLAPGTAYSYTVAACDAVGNCSARSAAAAATTPAAPDTQAPTVPTGLTATAVSSTQVKLTWTAASDNVGVTAYQLFVSGSLVDTLGNVTSSTRNNAPSSTYSYTVAACDAAGNCSAQSNAAVVMTPAAPDTQAPSVPGGLTAVAVSPNKINLTWTAATDDVGVTAYKVYRYGTLLANLGNVVTYGDSGLKGATTYSYTVSACDAAGNCSDQSAAATTVTPPAGGSQISVPGAPVVTMATSGDRKVTLVFTPPGSDGGSPITGYAVTCYPGAFAATGAASPLTVTGLTNGTAYACSVTASNAVGTGPASAVLSVTPSTTPVTVTPDTVTFGFEAAGYGVNETTLTATFTVIRSGNPSVAAAVNYQTGGGTATAGLDYIAAGGTLLFDAGQTAKTFTVPILNDTLVEPDETVNLNLVNPIAGTLGNNSATTLTIVSDDVSTGAANLTSTALTPAGADVVLKPDADSRVKYTGVTANTAPGAPPATTSIVRPADLAGFVTAAGGLPVNTAARFAYSLSTTAVYTGAIEVCLNVPSVNDPADFASLRLYHGEAGALIDRTITSPDASAPDFDTRRLCARVSSLGAFVIVASDTPSPSLKTPTPGDGQATLGWTTPAGAISFNVYEGNSSGAESPLPIITGITGSGAKITGLANGRTYYFTVTAVYAAGTSPPSNEVGVTPTGSVSAASTPSSTGGGGGAMSPLMLCLALLILLMTRPVRCVGWVERSATHRNKHPRSARDWRPGETKRVRLD